MGTGRTSDRLCAARARVWGIREAVVGRSRRRRTSGVTGRRERGVNVFGYFDSASGQAEAARGMLAALGTTDLPAVPVALRPFPGERAARHPDAVTPDHAPYQINLFYTNGDGMRGVLRQHGTDLFAGRHSVAVWHAELIPAPARWQAPSRHLDVLWAPSDHVAAALRPVVEPRVLRMPQPVPMPRPADLRREELGFPPGFVFHTMFDYSSTLARKNPVGTVLAFRRAFPEGDDPHLVIHAVNGCRHPRERREMRSAADGRRDILIRDGYVSPGVKDAMLAHCDCYVSLHRAEGFGLPLAEAMRLGKPVIATGWSGNLAFMTDRNSYLVDHRLVAVGHGSWPYPADGRWAEPDLDVAARWMREIATAPEAARARGRFGAETVARSHDPTVVGRRVRDQLAPWVDPVAGIEPAPSPASRG